MKQFAKNVLNTHALRILILDKDWKWGDQSWLMKEVQTPDSFLFRLLKLNYRLKNMSPVQTEIALCAIQENGSPPHSKDRNHLLDGLGLHLTLYPKPLTNKDWLDRFIKQHDIDIVLDTKTLIPAKSRNAQYDLYSVTRSESSLMRKCDEFLVGEI